MTSPIRIALAGCGTVGGALLELLATHDEQLRWRTGARFEVVRVLVRDLTRPRPGDLSRSLFTSDVGAFLATPADVTIEAIGGVEAAASIATTTLSAGRRLVTANKALLRAAGPALAALARTHSARGAALDFEAAVGGGVPIVRLLRESLAGQGLTSVRGVLNGTTNFLLSRIERGATFARAFQEARRGGFAEADPQRDLLGVDAADKIAVLAWLGFGVDPTTLAVRVQALPPDLVGLVAEADRRGRVARLVATAHRVGGFVHAHVAPVLLPKAHPFARAQDEENVIQVRSESTGTVTVSGRGAGGAATASALLADLVRAATPIPAPRAA